MAYSPETRTTQRSLSGVCLLLSELGFAPNTVIDVGVATHTEGLYKFREANFFLFEPMPEHQAPAQRLINNKSGKLFPIALSSSNGTATITAARSALDSAALNRTGGASDVSHEVEMKRLDEVLTPADLVSPVLLKSDVQGHDFHVLKGAGDLLRNVDVIVFEYMHFGENSLFEYHELLNSYGFEFYESISPLRRPYDDAVSQSDFVFVKRDSPLRAYKRYA